MGSILCLFCFFIAGISVVAPQGHLSILGLQMLKKIGFHRNVAISPINIAAALSMAKEAALGPTKQHLERLLGGEFSLRTTRPHELVLANHVFFDDKFRIAKEFSETLKSKYQVESSKSLDFRGKAQAACEAVNEWVSDATHGKINKLVDPQSVDHNTLWLIVSALYFEGKWEHAFASATPIRFRMPSEDRSFVPGMQVTARFKHASLDDVELIELPYEGNRFSLLLAVPHEFAGVLSDFAPPNLAAWDAALQDHHVHLSMPKFHLETPTIDLMKDVLPQLGLAPLFLAGNFSGVLEDHSKPVSVDRIFHKVVVDVDEQGTVAAAATAVRGRLRMAIVEKTVQMVVNRAFLFFIRDTKSKEVLIAGFINNPKDHPQKS